MSCSCHNKEGKAVEGTVRPDDQCLVCCAKHIEMALAAWGEFTYEETNRRFVAGHLRLAVEHTKHDWRDLALSIRDIATTIEMALDKDKTDIRNRLLDIQDLCLLKLNEQKPEIAKRLDNINYERKTDIVIPLGNGSKWNNDELRILLRSIERHAIGTGRIIIVSDNAPEWLANVEILPIKDRHSNCKDGNLIEKTLEAIKQYNLDSFVWCADDNAFMQDIRLDSIPILANSKEREEYASANANAWQERVFNTYEWADSVLKTPLKHNFESHAPQYFDDAQKLYSLMQGVPYLEGAGLTIMTAFRVVLRQTENYIIKDAYKDTFEKDCTGAEIQLTKVFCGYNDMAFATGLRDKLFSIFNTKSRFEK